MAVVLRGDMLNNPAPGGVMYTPPLLYSKMVHLPVCIPFAKIQKNGTGAGIV